MMLKLMKMLNISYSSGVCHRLSYAVQQQTFNRRWIHNITKWVRMGRMVGQLFDDYATNKFINVELKCVCVVCGVGRGGGKRLDQP